MNYKQYLKRTWDVIKNSKPWQKISASLVVAIILAVLVVLINPAKKLLEMRNSQRRSDVVNILNSVYQYSIDNNGSLPFVVTAEPQTICRTKAASCEGLVNIAEITGNKKKYLLSAVPIDPSEKNNNSSGYQIFRLSNGRIGVSAPLAENKAMISLSK